MTTKTLAVNFEDESEYPDRIFTIVGTATISIPDFKPCKLVSCEVTILAFDEYGISTNVDITDEWKEKILDHVVDKL